MHHPIRTAITLLLIAALAGCGFEPMGAVKQHGAASDSLLGEMAQVSVEVSSNQNKRLLTQHFRITLEDLINPGEQLATQKAYALRINLGSIASPGFIAPDGKAQRFLVNLRSSYSLVRLADGAVIENGQLNRTSSYSNLPNSYFSTYAAEQDTLKRLAGELAEQYRMKLASLLTSPPSTPSTPTTQAFGKDDIAGSRPDADITQQGIGGIGR